MKGLGKCLSTFRGAAIVRSANGGRDRFVAEDMSSIQRRLKREEAGLKSDVNDLEKKHTYLETTFSNAQDGLNAILRGGASGGQ